MKYTHIHTLFIITGRVRSITEYRILHNIYLKIVEGLGNHASAATIPKIYTRFGSLKSTLKRGIVIFESDLDFKQIFNIVKG